MTARDALWAALLLSVAKNQSHEIRNWKELRKAFGGTITKDVEVAQAFFCSGVKPCDPFPLDRQWICATNKLVNEANRELQSWRSEKDLSLGVVYVFPDLIEPLSNCPGLSEAQQIDFIESIETADLPQTRSIFLKGILLFCFETLENALV
jgi:hypothetical protein